MPRAPELTPREFHRSRVAKQNVAEQVTNETHVDSEDRCHGRRALLGSVVYFASDAQFDGG